MFQKIDVGKTGVKNHDTKKMGSKCCWVPKNNRQQKFRVKNGFQKDLGNINLGFKNIG